MSRVECACMNSSVSLKTATNAFRFGTADNDAGTRWAPLLERGTVEAMRGGARKRHFLSSNQAMSSTAGSTEWASAVLDRCCKEQRKRQLQKD